MKKELQPQRTSGHIEEQSLSDQQNVSAGSSVTTLTPTCFKRRKHLSDHRQIVNVDSSFNRHASSTWNARAEMLDD
jgi:hypothetical protein